MIYPVYMHIKEVAFLEGLLFSRQSEQFKKLSKSSGPEKSHFVFGHVIRLIRTL